MDSNERTNNATKTVLSFIEALNKENFGAARTRLKDDMRFTGVLGKRNGADVYIDDMEKMKFKYQVLKTFTDGNDVCLLYNITMSGKQIFSCGWYKVSDSKIESLNVVFDPRPVLNDQPKN